MGQFVFACWCSLDGPQGLIARDESGQKHDVLANLSIAILGDKA